MIPSISPNHIKILLHPLRPLRSEYLHIFTKDLLLPQDSQDADTDLRSARDETPVHGIAALGRYFGERGCGRWDDTRAFADYRLQVGQRLGLGVGYYGAGGDGSSVYFVLELAVDAGVREDVEEC